MKIQRTAIILLFLLLSAAGIRFFYLRESAGRPEFVSPSVDAAYHDYWARCLAAGAWSLPRGFQDPEIPLHPYFRPPGYPYLLALLYRAGGFGYLIPRIFQAVLGLATMLTGFIFARKRYGDLTALIFSALLGWYWIFIYYEGELLGTAVSVFLTVALLAALCRWGEEPGMGRGLTAGLILGLFSLFRPNILLFAPAAGIWFWYRARGRSGKKTILVSLLVFIGGMLLLILPVTVRNYRVSGDLVPISAQGGMSLLIANNPRSDGSNHYLPGYGRLGSPFDYPSAVRKIGAGADPGEEEISHAQASRFFALQALEYIIDNPGRFLELTGRRFLLFWGPAEVTNNREIATVRSRSRVLGGIPLNFSLIFALFLAGTVMFFFDRRRSPEARIIADGTAVASSAAVLVLLFIGVYFLSVLPFVAAARYRVPVIVGLLLFSARALHSFGTLVRKRRFWRLTAWLAVAAGLFFFVRINWGGYQSSPAKWWGDRGRALAEAGEAVRAIAAYRRALEIKPDYSMAANNLGELLLAKGNPGKAVEQFRIALRSEPDSADIRSNLGEAFFRKGDYRRADEWFGRALEIDPASARAHNNRGVMFYARGNYRAAEANFRAALNSRPAYGRAHYNLGLVLQDRGEIEEAIEHYRQAARLRSFDPRPHNNLGNILTARGEFTAALRAYRRALELDPDLIPARINLANLLARAGDYPAALSYYRAALERDPDNPGAHYNLAFTLEKLDDKKGARKHYRKALESDPKNGRAHYRLALLLLEEGREVEAGEHLRRAAEIDPAFQPPRDEPDVLKSY